MNRFDVLKSKLSEIKELSTGFPENLQAVVCKGLIDSLYGDSVSESANGRDLRGPQQKLLAPPSSGDNGAAQLGDILTTASGRREWPGIASFEPSSGKFSISVRNWKAKARTEQARRLAYVAIRAREKLTGEETTSSRDFVTPLLKEHRLYDGNSRSVLANDKGIQRDGDELRLDVPGKAEADRIIAEILSDD